MKNNSQKGRDAMDITGLYSVKLLYYPDVTHIVTF